MGEGCKLVGIAFFWIAAMLVCLGLGNYLLDRESLYGDFFSAAGVLAVVAALLYLTGSHVDRRERAADDD